MKQYLTRILIFIFLYFGVLLLIYVQPYKYDNFFQSAETKAERLKKKEPQIIFVGGSNTLFGIDSKMVADEMGYDVVNMGIHMGLGYYFQTNQVLHELRKDDIVLLTPEYVSYFKDKEVNKPMLNQISEHYPTVLFQFNRMNRFKLFYEHFLDKLKKNIAYIQQGKSYNLGPIDGYSFSGVNEYGDQTDHLKEIKGKKLGRWNMKIHHGESFHPVFINQTNKILNKCKEVGCEVYFTFPVIAKTAFDRSVAEKLATSLDEFGFPRLGNPIDYVFEPEEFYDTHYHPLKNARAERTNKVIEELKKR